MVFMKDCIERSHKVHKDCRRHCTKASSIKSALKIKEYEYLFGLSTSSITSELRESTYKFDFKKNCFICSTTADEKGKLEQSR